MSSRGSSKLDKAIKRTIKKANVEAEKAGSTLRVGEAVCPKCGSPDVNLKFPPQKGFKCWDCGTVYRLAGMENFTWQ